VARRVVRWITVAVGVAAWILGIPLFLAARSALRRILALAHAAGAVPGTQPASPADASEQPEPLDERRQARVAAEEAAASRARASRRAN
jgi:hypothetical protein